MSKTKNYATWLHTRKHKCGSRTAHFRQDRVDVEMRRPVSPTNGQYYPAPSSIHALALSSRKSLIVVNYRISFFQGNTVISVEHETTTCVEMQTPQREMDVSYQLLSNTAGCNRRRHTRKTTHQSRSTQVLHHQHNQNGTIASKLGLLTAVGEHCCYTGKTLKIITQQHIFLIRRSCASSFSFSPCLRSGGDCQLHVPHHCLRRLFFSCAFWPSRSRPASPPQKAEPVKLK